MASWYVIPTHHKWSAHIAAAAVIAHTLLEIDPQDPVVAKPAGDALLAEKTPRNGGLGRGSI